MEIPLPEKLQKTLENLENDLNEKLQALATQYKGAVEQVQRIHNNNKALILEGFLSTIEDLPEELTEMKIEEGSLILE